MAAVWFGWLSALVALPIGIFIRGVCISFAWGWFIAPVTGWREISTVEAVGISLFFSILNQEKPKEKDFSDMDNREIASHVAWTALGYSILGPLISLFLAWLWQTFAMPISN